MQGVGAREADLARSGLQHVLLLGALALVYFLAGKLGLYFASVHASASAVWPPTGIALAALLLLGRRAWPAIFVGAFFVNLTTSGSIASSLGIAVGNTLEATVGAALVTRYAGGIRAFELARDFLRFVVLAGLFSTAISATIGVTSLAIAGQASWSALGPIWITWWLGDAAGALIVTPALVLWGARPELGPLRTQPLEAIALLAVIVATAFAVFVDPTLGRYPLPFLCIPPLIWAAFRFGQREVATCVALLSAIATLATVQGLGPFAIHGDNESLLLLQSFMATTAVLTLPVAALVWERKGIEHERTRLLDAERSARSEAEAANHAKDEFLAMLSHELRNPLSAIANAAQVLAMPPTPRNYADRAVDIIDRQARHLSRLIDDLLDVARVASGKILLTKEKLDLAAVVEGCLTLLRGGGRLDQHHVVVDLAPVWVMADPSRLTQIIDNLLLNAIKYTPAGGQIEVRTSSERDESVLRIRDNGIGIAPDLLPHVFELFTQGPRALDRSQGGIGVGLTLANRLVLAHGGQIFASSEGSGKGSTFTLRLPRIDPPEATPALDSPATIRMSPPRRILIIEDDPDGRESLRMQLSVAGHDVHQASSGEEGIETAARVHPDIVLLDIGLPGLDGYQVAERLRAANGGARLIAITGYGQPEDRERARSAGIDGHLVKPIDAAELRRALA